MRSIDVVAFDLDDTLIQLSPNFIPEYLGMLSEYLQSAFPHAGAVDEALLASSNAMMQKTRDPRGLEDFFFDDFCGRTGIPRNSVKDPLLAFYDREFHRLEHLARPVYGAMGTLASVRAAGCRVALLTSPLFPARAIEWRLRWAGLEDFPWDWKTSLEVASATKPQPDYYREAADRLGVNPACWLMVGNDLVEDIVPAHHAGMAVYWVKTGAIDDQERALLPPGKSGGPLQRVISVLDELQRKGRP